MQPSSHQARHVPRRADHSGLTSLIQASQLEVIAEGVETDQQWDVLRSANIQSAQGFHFSRPLPAASFIAYHSTSESKKTPSALPPPET